MEPQRDVRPTPSEWVCNLITVQLNVPQVTCDISDANVTCNITAAVILPEDDSYEMSLSKIMPVLEAARLFVRSNNWLPANVNLIFLPMDDRCSNVYSIFRALHAYSTCAHVLFGPSCEYALGECIIVRKWSMFTATSFFADKCRQFAVMT